MVEYVYKKENKVMWQTKYFKDEKSMQRWIARNSKRFRIHEVIVESGYAVDYKKKAFIYA